MTTITVPLSESLNEFLETQVKIGNASSKADLVRTAIKRYKEEEFIKMIQLSRQEIKDGKGLTGDLDDLSKIFE
jgi:Arc/MetJ-type ribon-helix-helix transcriptional regulator